MKISKITIKSLFGIKEWSGDGKNIELVGDNGTGKTSVIDAIRYALTNASDREYIIKNGETEGEIFIETDSGLSIDRKPRQGMTDYKSVKQNGNVVHSPETFLKTIFTPLQLSPMEFISMDKKTQNATILDMIQYDWNLDTIKEWFGELPPDVNYEQNILAVLNDIQAENGYFEGTLPTFSAQHPEIFSSRGKTAGELKSEYKQASIMIDRAVKDPVFMQYMAGDKQVIMTGEIEGVPVKIKIDSADGRRITDLKTVKSITETFYAKDLGQRLNFCEWWGYDLQAAVYREIYRQNTGDLLPFYICAVSKDKTDNIPHPRIKVIEVPPLMMDEKLAEVKNNMWIRKTQGLRYSLKR